MQPLLALGKHIIGIFKITYRNLKCRSPRRPSLFSGSAVLVFSVALASASSLLSGAGSVGAVGECGLLPPVGCTDNQEHIQLSMFPLLGLRQERE